MIMELHKIHLTDCTIVLGITSFHLWLPIVPRLGVPNKVYEKESKEASDAHI